jgi:hypothetical protein
VALAVTRRGCAPAGRVARPAPFLAPRRVIAVVLRALAARRCAARVLAWSCSFCGPLARLLAAPLPAGLSCCSLSRLAAVLLSRVDLGQAIAFPE